VPGEELPALYSGARCFAFPSLAEGFGRPCIEAMACGAPVVASNRTALPETCGDAALLPDAEDEKAVAEALRAACLDDAVRKRLVEAGLKRAAESSPGRFAAELLKAFEAALAGPKEGLWSG
jgi:alpha-1,3-rhamnosyl/mannosyltransferase